MSLLSDELRARIGETRVYVAPEPLSRAAIRYYAQAVGDDNPLYTDTAAALAAGLPDVVAPPTLLCDTNQYCAGTPDADGFAGHSWGIEVPGTRTVRGGNDYRFFRYARPDDVVTVEWRLADIAEVVNSSGSAMLIVTSEALVTDQHGEQILRNTETIIHVAVASA
ncbi:MAG: hypothetical protein EPN43_09940 [Jatrophihabitans sp.]|nr:MAG: hypothetical protein EPN43_09940 [Jatrophihabitans sp.]